MQQLSDRVGVGQVFVFYLESGERASADADTLVRIADALDTDPDVVCILGDKIPDDVMGVFKRRPQAACQAVRALDESD